jgi:hypothetical protein
MIMKIKDVMRRGGPRIKAAGTTKVRPSNAVANVKIVGGTVKISIVRWKFMDSVA